MQDDKKILSAIKSAIHSVDADAVVILFGSRARGDAHEESDWDVLILVDEENITYDYRQKFARPVLEVELEYVAAISKLIINKKKWYTDYQGYPLQIEVEKDKVLL